MRLAGHQTRSAIVYGALGLAVVAIALSAASAAFAADQVRVRFSWKLKGEYAPLYLAQEKGLFAAKGLEVRMGEGAGSQAALGALLQDQEDVVILPGIFAISAIQKGIPVKLIALYHPATPVVIITHPEKPATTPKELEGKTIATAVGETGTSYLGTLCAVNKVDCDKIKRVHMDAQARVAQFLQKQVDAVSVYRSNDLPIIEKRVGKKFAVLDLPQFGLAVPGLSALSSDAIIAKRSDVLKRFLAAMDEAITMAKADPKAAAAALAKNWSGGPSLDIVEAQVQATMDAMASQADHAVGWIDPKIIDSSIELLKTEETIEKPRPANAFFTNDLLVR